VAPVDLIANATTQLASNLTIPPIDTASAVTINPGATTVVSNPNLPGVSVTIPAGTAKNADGTLYTGSLSISPVPEYGRPESRPVELRPGLSITIQPAGITLDPPAPLTFPNVDNLAPGDELDLWSLSPDTGTFNLVGAMRVSADRQRLETISGGVRKTAWHFPLPPSPQPNQSGTDQVIGQCTECEAGSQADLTEGALALDERVPGVRTLGVARDLTLHYRSTSADVQPIIPVDAALSQRVLGAEPQTFSARLTIGGVQQGAEVFWNAGLPGSVSRLGVQFDAFSLATGRYPYELMLFSNYPFSSIGGATRGQVLIRNERGSPLGAGWSLGGVHRLHVNKDGSLLLSEGEGATKLFTPGPLSPTRPINVLAVDTNSGKDCNPPRGSALPAWDYRLVKQLTGLQVTEVTVEAFATINLLAFDVLYIAETFQDGCVTIAAQATLDALAARKADIAAFLSSGRGVVALSEPIGQGLLAWLPNTLRPTLFLDAQGHIVHSDVIRILDETHPVLSAVTSAGLSNWGQSAHGVFADPGGLRTIVTDDQGRPVTLVGQLNGGRIVVTAQDPEFHNFFGRTDQDQADFVSNAIIFAAGDQAQIDTFVGPPGDFATLAKNTDGTFTRTLKEGTRYEFNAQGLQTAVVDRNGNTTTYAYDGSGNLTTITDPAGQVTTLSYSGNRVSSITDPGGRITQFEHDGEANLTAITYADGSRETFSYDPQHRLIQRTDARGKVYQYAYDYAGRFSQATLPTGEVRTLMPTQRAAVPNLAAGQGTKENPAPLATPNPPATFQDGNGHTSTFTLDQLGRITKQTDALNRVTAIQRDANGNPIQITRPNGAITTMTYDAKGNLLTTTEQAIGATTTFAYESTFNQVTSITDPLNHTTTITYDAKGNPLTITDADNKVTTLTYDSRGLLTSTKDALDQMTTLGYDAQGRLVRTTDPLNRTTTLTYDGAGNVATSTDALNRVTSFEYDAFNRLKKVTDPLTGVTQYTYDGNGNLLSVKDAKNQTTTFAYDARNRLASTTDPLGKVETYTYDGADNLLTRVTPKGDTISFAHDAVNQLLSKTLPGSQVTSYTYDAVGNLTGVTDPDSKLTMTYDLAHRLTSVATAGSSNQPAVTVPYTYDKNGNRLTLADPTGTTRYSYDALNRLITLTSPNQTCSSAPPNGLVSWWRGEGNATDSVGANHGTLRNGATFAPGREGQAFSLDAVDDYVSLANTTTMDVGTGEFSVAFWVQFHTLAADQTLFNKDVGTFPNDQTYLVEYDVANPSAGTPAGLRFLVRDTTANQNDLVAPVSLNTEQWYHVVAVRTGSTSQLYLDGTLIGTQTAGTNMNTGTGGLAALGRLAVSPARFVGGLLDEVQFYNRALAAGDISPLTCSDMMAYTYDVLSRRTSVTLPNGTQTTYTYDPASQVTSLLHKIVSSAAQINKADYVYNTVGNRTSLTDRRGVQSFGYDGLDRLTSATHPLTFDQTFAYDLVGNRTTNASLYNIGNQLTEDTNFTYTYDLNGNLTRKTFKSSGNHTDYTYDAENRLIRVDEFAAGSSTPGATSTYRYDGLGRRIEKVGNGITRRYIYDGEDILLEYNETNTLQARYTNGPGIDEPIAMQRGGSNFFYHADGLGTVTELTDGSGATAQSYAYDAWGNIIQQTGAVENPYTYTGREFDAETGLYYYRARYYDSKIGRFLQKDPIGFRGGVNFYAYVGNNPIRFKDPFGQSCDTDKCKGEADEAYNKCIGKIDRLETYYTTGCVVGSVAVGALTIWGTGSPLLGASVGAIGVAGCLLIDWESIPFPVGKASCGFLRQRIYDACKASQ